MLSARVEESILASLTKESIVSGSSENRLLGFSIESVSAQNFNVRFKPYNTG